MGGLGEFSTSIIISNSGSTSVVRLYTEIKREPDISYATALKNVYLDKSQ